MYLIPRTGTVVSPEPSKSFSVVTVIDVSVVCSGVKALDIEKIDVFLMKLYWLMLLHFKKNRKNIISFLPIVQGAACSLDPQIISSLIPDAQHELSPPTPFSHSIAPQNSAQLDAQHFEELFGCIIPPYSVHLSGNTFKTKII